MFLVRSYVVLTLLASRSTGGKKNLFSVACFYSNYVISKIERILRDHLIFRVGVGNAENVSLQPDR